MAKLYARVLSTIAEINSKYVDITRQGGDNGGKISLPPFVISLLGFVGYMIKNFDWAIQMSSFPTLPTIILI